jgi:4-nitrophenyl phosphatase
VAARLRGFLFDMAGVLYRGARPLPGGRALLAALDRRGVPFALVTNNSTRTPRQYVRHLARMGIRVREDRIVTSSGLTAAYLTGRLRPGARVLLIGEPAFRRTLERAGFVVGGGAPAAVVVGLDRRLTYRKLAAATAALLDGAAFVAANPDPLLPTADGVVPGTGAALAALRYATGRRPEIMGKPSPRLLREAMRRIGTRPADTVMVGDQLSTDIAAARAAGTLGVLVQSGVSAARGGPLRPRPDLVVRDLRQLWRWASSRL